VFKQILVLVVLVIAGAGLWFQMNKEEEGPTEEELQLRKNAQLMKECIDRENSLNAAAQKAGDHDLAVDSKALCAEKYNFYEADGHWHQLNTNDAWAPR
jgi:hypothetical protein